MTFFNQTLGEQSYWCGLRHKDMRSYKDRCVA